MALRAVPDHPKFADLKARLNRPKYVALGCLEAIWHFAGRFTPQGNIGKYTDHAIEAWVEWDGAPGELIDALRGAGWIDTDPVHRLLVHDWAQHADKATKQSLGRVKLKFCVPTVHTQGEHLEHVTPNNGTPYSPLVPVPVPVPVPEPRAKTCTEASSAPALGMDGKPLLLPLINGKDWNVPAADCLEWAAAYPAVDVHEQLLKMRVWLAANPKNRKTPNGVRRFVVSWLARSQDSARPTGGSNGHVNRGQARTDSNRAAAIEAAERIAAKATDGVG